MDQELQDKLYKKYPRLFAQKDWSIRESCMPWGIETGSGWYTVIDAMCQMIQGRIDNYRNQRARALRHNRVLKLAAEGKTSYLENHLRKLRYTEEHIQEMIKPDKVHKFWDVPEKPPQLQFVQIKEKYGTLRVYHTTRPHNEQYDAYFQGIINMAEAMSAHICETCGQPGEIRGAYWLYTACDQHTNEQDKG